MFIDTGQVQLVEYISNHSWRKLSYC